MIGRQSGRTCQTLQSKSKSGWTVISGGRRAIGTGSGGGARRSVGGNEGVAVVLVEKLCVVILLFNRGLEGGVASSKTGPNHQRIPPVQYQPSATNSGNCERTAIFTTG